MSEVSCIVKIETIFDDFVSYLKMFCDLENLFDTHLHLCFVNMRSLKSFGLLVSMTWVEIVCRVLLAYSFSIGSF